MDGITKGQRANCTELMSMEVQTALQLLTVERARCEGTEVQTALQLLTVKRARCEGTEVQTALQLLTVERARCEELKCRLRCSC